MDRDDGYTRYTVRIPTPLYERVKEAAGEKSINAQIVEVLAEKYPPRTDDDFILAGLIAFIRAAHDAEDRVRRVAIANERLGETSKWRTTEFQLTDDGARIVIRGDMGPDYPPPDPSSSS